MGLSRSESGRRSNESWRKSAKCPSRIGTRVSPRTIQRQTGLGNYKDTSSEMDSDQEEEEANGEEEDDDQEVEDEEEAEEEEEEEEDKDGDMEGEEVQVKPAVTVTRTAKKVAKKRGRKPKKRRPV